MAGRCGKQQESLTKLGEWAGKSEEPRENKVINLGRGAKQMTVRKDIGLGAVSGAQESALERHQAVGREGPEHSYSVLLLTGLSFSTVDASLKSERNT